MEFSELASELKKKNYDLYVLSGDNDSEKEKLKKIFNKNTELRFNQSPQQKLDFIKSLQTLHPSLEHGGKGNKNVLMLGDGLNDAGALMQSNVGIAVSDNTSQFSPACDAILDGSQVKLIDKFLAYAQVRQKYCYRQFYSFHSI